MSTIALYSNKVSLMSELIGDVKTSVGNYITELTTLSNQTLNVNKSICNLDDVISSIQSSTQTQDLRIDSLEAFRQNSEDYIAEVVRIDSNVADTINQSKDDFYEQYNYLKPECEKSGWDKFCDGLASAGEWCKENWESVVSLVLAVIIVVAIVALCVVTFGAFAVVVAAIVGIVVGIGSQLASDYVAGRITGEFQLSSWQTYVGSAIGGGVGGILMLTGNPVLACSVDGAISTFIGGHLENITGGERSSSAGILFDTALSAGLSALFSAALGKITGKLSKVLSKSFPSITFLRRLAGRGSYEASFKMVLTKITKGQVKNVSLLTLRNGITSGLSGSFFENIADGIWNATFGEWIDKRQPETQN